MGNSKAFKTHFNDLKVCLQEFETNLTAKGDALQTFWHKLEIPKLFQPIPMNSERVRMNSNPKWLHKGDIPQTFW